MKKLICICMVLLLMAGTFSGCGQTAKKEEETITVVTTIFPLYDWVREIVKDDVHIKLSMLLDNGVDLHSYQPTAQDILKISSCDIFIYVGGESDAWVSDALKEATNKDMVVLNLMEIMGDKAKEEEIVEGMQEEEHDHDHEEGPEYDEHIWLSLKNTEFLCGKIEEALEKADPEHKEQYEENLEAYHKQLDDLDSRYDKAVSEASTKTVLFGDRFPFRYLTDDYSLTYYAAFVGCSAETEASFETVVFLAQKVDELGLKNILTIETSDGKIAETIRDNTQSKDQHILVMDSLQSVTSKDVQAGTTYLSIMEKNLTVLEDALS